MDQLDLFYDKSMPLTVVMKEDRLDGYIFLCPSCKTYVCAGDKCQECGQSISWKNSKVDFYQNGDEHVHTRSGSKDTDL